MNLTIMTLMTINFVILYGWLFALEKRIQPQKLDETMKDYTTHDETKINAESNKKTKKTRKVP